MKKSATIPFDFVLERLQLCAPAIRPMFGCHAVYVAEKLVLILRKKEEATYDNGVWLATAAQHHQSLKSMFPSLRSIRLFGGNVSAWQNIPEDAGDFEESAITACELILKNDPRIGKIPKRKSKSIRRH